MSAKDSSPEAGSDLLPEDVEGLLPHAPPFLFVSRPVALSADEGLFHFDSPRQGECNSLRMFSSLLFVEALAQSTAAFSALSAPDDAPKESGALVAVERFRSYGRGRPGDTYLLKVKRTKAFGALVRFTGEVWLGHRLLAEGILTVRRDTPGEADS